jgi:aryl-alcohol dehydrogenase-like predicted oxidoreductase
MEARTAEDARRELAGYLDELATDYLDVATYYYVESQQEWDAIIAPGGAAEALEAARAAGTLRAIGLTSHQRPLAAQIAETGRLDLLMIRYNAAHRGAEREVFPTTTRLALPVVAFTCLRWGALLRATPADPPGESVPAARDWYRFVLSQPAVSIALMAPDTAAELDENLSLLDESWSLDPHQRQRLIEQAERVRRFAGSFP